MTLSPGTKVTAVGHPATVVARTDDIPGNCGQPGCYVVAMTGEGGTTPGEQWAAPADEIEAFDREAVR